MGIVILVSIVSYSRLLRGILTYKTTLIKHQPFFDIHIADIRIGSCFYFSYLHTDTWDTRSVLRANYPSLYMLEIASSPNAHFECLSLLVFNRYA